MWEVIGVCIAIVFSGISLFVAITSAGEATLARKAAEEANQLTKAANDRVLREQRMPHLTLEVGKPDLKWGTPFNVVLRSDQDFDKLTVHADNQLGQPVAKDWAGGIHGDPLSFRAAADADLQPLRPGRTVSTAWTLVRDNVNAGQAMTIYIKPSPGADRPGMARLILRCECYVASETEPYETILDTGEHRVQTRLL